MVEGAHSANGQACSQSTQPRARRQNGFRASAEVATAHRGWWRSAVSRLARGCGDWLLPRSRIRWAPLQAPVLAHIRVHNCSLRQGSSLLVCRRALPAPCSNPCPASQQHRALRLPCTDSRTHRTPCLKKATSAQSPGWRRFDAYATSWGDHDLHASILDHRPENH